MNVETGTAAIALAGVFAALPHDLTSKCAAVFLVGGILYLLEGKIPKSI
jgi:hypothetical protein